MSPKRRYPSIGLRSKNEIAKRIASPSFPQGKALELINYVLLNFENCWYDSPKSMPDKGKYVRSAAKSDELRKLLHLINKKILAPYDNMVPGFIFGGLSKRNTIEAAHHLLGNQRQRALLKLDIKSFFEQIREERVAKFYKICGCSPKAAKILAKVSCVSSGPKGSLQKEKILARGFATSSRLAVWCNLDIFQHLEWKLKKKLKGHDPRVAVYVDDVGITASRVSIEDMQNMKNIATNILENHDVNQALPVHADGKTRIFNQQDGAEYLGLKFGRNKLSIGSKTRSRVDKLKSNIKKSQSSSERAPLIKKRKAYGVYQSRIASASS